MAENRKAEFGTIGIDNPIACSVVERLNRFAVKVQVAGSYHVAHIGNAGRLYEFLVKGRNVNLL